jgi:hypothetical protein
MLQLTLTVSVFLEGVYRHYVDTSAAVHHHLSHRFAIQVTLDEQRLHVITNVLRFLEHGRSAPMVNSVTSPSGVWNLDGMMNTMLMSRVSVHRELALSLTSFPG